MDSLILPDTITFEELAAKWCADEWLRQLENDCLFFNALIHSTSQQEMKFYLQEFTLGDNNWELENQEAIACLDLNSRHLCVTSHNSFEHDDLFQPILNYIKERSHG